MGEVEPIVHIQQRVEDLFRTTDTSFRQVHSTLVEIRQHADRHAETFVDRLREVDEASYQATRKRILAEWHNRTPGRIIFTGSLAVAFVVFFALRAFVNAGTLGTITRLMMFGTGSVTGLVLLWGSAFNEIRPNDASPWHRLRKRGKVLVLAIILSLACTAWTILIDKQASERTLNALGDVQKAAGITLQQLGTANHELDVVNGQLQHVNDDLKPVKDRLTEVHDQLEPLSTRLRVQATLFQNQLGAATEQLRQNLEIISGQIKLIAKASDAIANIKTSTDTIAEVKKSTDAIGDIKKATDAIDGVKRSTDTLAELQRQTDKIAKAVGAAAEADKIVALDKQMHDLRLIVDELTRKVDALGKSKVEDKSKVADHTPDPSPAPGGNDARKPPAGGPDKTSAAPGIGTTETPIKPAAKPVSPEKVEK